MLNQSAVINLVLRIQNDENQVGLTLSDQPDLSNINSSYRDKGGAFWVAEDKSGAIVGCIGLMVLSAEIGVLKKFFVDSAFRGLGKGITTKPIREVLWPESSKLLCGKTRKAK